LGQFRPVKIRNLGEHFRCILGWSKLGSFLRPYSQKLEEAKAKAKAKVRVNLALALALALSSY